MLENRFKPSYFFLQTKPFFLLFELKFLEVFELFLLPFGQDLGCRSITVQVVQVVLGVLDLLPHPVSLVLQVLQKPQPVVLQVEKRILQLFPLSDQLGFVVIGLDEFVVQFDACLFQASRRAISDNTPKVLLGYPTTCPSFRLLLLLLPCFKCLSRVMNRSSNTGPGCCR